MSILAVLFLALTLILPAVSAQSPDLWQPGEAKIVAIVPLTGAGTYRDPVRPRLPEMDREAPQAVSIRWIATDDARSAIVLLSAPNSQSLIPFREDQRPGVQVFDRNQQTRAFVEAEIRKHRRDFRWENLYGIRSLTPAAGEVKP